MLFLLLALLSRRLLPLLQWLLLLLYLLLLLLDLDLKQALGLS